MDDLFVSFAHCQSLGAARVLPRFVDEMAAFRKARDRKREIGMCYLAEFTFLQEGAERKVV